MSRMKIIGNTVGTPLPKPNLMQDDPAKGDYVKGRSEFAEQLQPGAVLTKTEKDLILELFRNASYASVGMNPTYTQLETLWNGSGEGGGDVHFHSYTSSITTAATCTTAGVRTYTCSCGHSYTESIPATGHNYVDGVCTVCGAADPTYNPEVTLTHISAKYSGGSVPVGTPVNSLTGVTVTAHYSDGSSENVGGYTLSGTIEEGYNTITVSYSGKTVAFVVMGVAASVTLTSISATYSGGSVTAETDLTALTGIVVTARYSDGSTATVTDYTLSGTIAEGSNTVTVSYGGKTTTFTVVGVVIETEVSNETKWTPGVAYTYTPVAGEYVDKTTGATTAYVGWDRTPYLYCAGAARLRYELQIADNSFSSASNSRYNAFYDSEKVFIKSFSIEGGINTTVGSYTDVEIPENAAYFVSSHKHGVYSTWMDANGNPVNDSPTVKITPYE